MDVTVYVTKYATTVGIVKEKGKYDKKKGLFTSTNVDGSTYFHFYYKEWQDFHLTEKSAKEAAEKMRQNEIAVLKKQIAKLEAIKF